MTTGRKTGELRNPGDPDRREIVERIVRVDQAGEFGAVRIYEGQLAALRWTDRKSTRLNSSHSQQSRMPSSA